MAGLYIHIPFCTRKCHYCNFFSQPALHLVPSYVEAICREIEIRKEYLSEPVKTIYFGGGTPGLLSAAQIERILNTAANHLDIQLSEVTLEANPDNLSVEYLRNIKNVGVDRLSIGVQSFNNTDLKWLNRNHSGETAIESISNARSAGFENISIDLIYGIPVQTTTQWKSQIDIALSLHPEHISAYALTVEPGTALHHFIRKGKRSDVSDKHAEECFRVLKRQLGEHGYTHYEVSNFCLPGKESMHNSAYWDHTPYLGVGASAHSFDGKSRQWNIAAINQYINDIGIGTVPAEREELSEVTMLNEYLMVSIRTSKGCNLNHINQVYGEEFENKVLMRAKPFIENRLLELTDKVIKTSEQGWFHLDGIASSLFEDEVV
jgi:oxygen-independent coproporphyrinogen-3 oxidase